MKILVYVCATLFVFNSGMSVWHLLRGKWSQATYHLVLGMWMWYITTII